jgi:undecaprenyl-diphosphatase
VIEDILKAIALGVVQGLTEFLPVSSTAHLIIAEDVLGIDDERYGLAFDASLHMGTLAALLAYFGGRWFRLIGAGAQALVHRAGASRSSEDPDGRLAWLIVLGTLPAAAIGFAFERQIEDHLRSPWLIASMLIAFSGVFVAAERLGRREHGIERLGALDALIVGVAQAVALVPGVSRSGATISAGLLRGYDRRDAATFAFLLSAPVIAGAGTRASAGAVRDFIDGTLGRDEAVFFGVAVVTAAIVGYGAIAFLLRFLAANSLLTFAWYRVALGLTIFAVLAARAFS